MRTAIVAIFAQCAVPLAGVVAQGPNADHQEMLAKLGITSPLRPGPGGRLLADGTAPPNFANYDERKARAKSAVPPLFAMDDGRPITTPPMWETRRRELLEIFDREAASDEPGCASASMASTALAPG